ncbi:MAG TPA: type III pantothenate kinase [Planctomicrobium sp.]|nr:type III pantothenate kinase [Planctomicrobium sp.]
MSFPEFEGHHRYNRETLVGELPVESLRIPKATTIPVQMESPKQGRSGHPINTVESMPLKETIVSADCLVVDAGHTRVKFVACQRNESGGLPEIVASCAVLYGTPIDWTRIAGWFSLNALKSVLVMGTDSQRVQQVVADWSPLLPAPTLFTDKKRLPLKVDVDFPERVGIDRLLNAVAANILRAPDQPTITVGAGTAVTVDLIDATGTFRGGAILPGILLGAKSLHTETTTLPHVNVWELLKQAPSVIGKNTDAAIASGLYWGHLGAIRELVTRLREHVKNDSSVEPLLLLTGGAAGIVAPDLTGSQLIDELPIRGLAAVAEQVVEQIKS